MLDPQLNLMVVNCDTSPYDIMMKSWWFHNLHKQKIHTIYTIILFCTNDPIYPPTRPQLTSKPQKSSDSSSIIRPHFRDKTSFAKWTTTLFYSILENINNTYISISKHILSLYISFFNILLRSSDGSMKIIY